MKRITIPLTCLLFLVASCNSETIFQEDFESETINEPTGVNPDGDPPDDKIKIIAGTGTVLVDPYDSQNRMMSLNYLTIIFSNPWQRF